MLITIKILRKKGVMDELYRELQKFGFSLYECKAYIALLKHSPVTGYEISKRSGVPRSTIYEVMGKLLDKGAVYTVPSEPVTYAPLPAKKLISRLRSNFERSFEYLENQLGTLEGEQEIDVIHRISGEDHIMSELLDMISKAEEELWLSVWEPQVALIEEAVKDRLKEDVIVYSILFGAPDITLGRTTHHNFMSPEVVEKRTNGRLTILARDNQEVLIANFSSSTAAWAVKTEDPALVLIAMEFIRHDLMFSELAEASGPEKAQALWMTNPDLFRVVTGKPFETKSPVLSEG